MTLQIELLEKSFQLVAPKGDALVTRFYERLFQKYPVVRPLFHNANMTQQKKKLLGSLVLVIQNLRKPEALRQALMEMGLCLNIIPLWRKICSQSWRGSPEPHGRRQCNRPGKRHSTSSTPSCLKEPNSIPFPPWPFDGHRGNI